MTMKGQDQADPHGPRRPPARSGSKPGIIRRRDHRRAWRPGATRPAASPSSPFPPPLHRAASCRAGDDHPQPGPGTRGPAHQPNPRDRSPSMNHLRTETGGQAGKAARDERTTPTPRPRAAFTTAQRHGKSVIPFGQPILVGHHSETRDRNYRKRIHGQLPEERFDASKKAKRRSAERAASVGKGGISSDDPEAVAEAAK